MAIKIDMEMPKYCEDCPCAWFDLYEQYEDPSCNLSGGKTIRNNYSYPIIVNENGKTPRSERCPLVEVD